jgi:hypothetical protein
VVSKAKSPRDKKDVTMRSEKVIESPRKLKETPKVVKEHNHLKEILNKGVDSCKEAKPVAARIEYKK